MDFVQIKEREGHRKNTLEVYPDYKIVRSKDLMVRGKSFYAIWDDKLGLWSTDEYDVQRLVDELIDKYEVRTVGEFDVKRKVLGNYSTSSWLQFRNYVAHLTDSYTQLDENIVFANTEVKKEDYVSRKLPYSLSPGDISAWDELVSTLYNPEERAKIEWAIGAIVSGDSKTIQKFLVFYGAMGTGKSTILNIIEKLFRGYTEAFVAKELTGANNQFAMESFKKNPLVAIDHDGDLSKIQDNTKLNSLVSHEIMQINEKNKPLYSMRFNAMLMIGSNNPVKITDGKSGLIRRLIDIHPTGNLLSPRKYQSLYSQIDFELGAIAAHCLEVYREMGKDYYSGYRPTEMMQQTDVFFNFIEAHFDIFKAQGGVTWQQAWELYKKFIEESAVEYKLTKFKLREELKNYFETFEDRAILEDGTRVRSWFSNFNAERFKAPTGKPEEQHMFALVMEEEESLLDKRYAEYPAQYSKDDGTPQKFWTDDPREKVNPKTGKVETWVPKPSQVVSTVLADLDTTKEHYVKIPENEIVIDFDLTDKDGKKSAERNLEKASQWPATYAEFSKSGEGIHLHYYYDGDPSELASLYDDGIEVKVYRGNSSLRRRFSRGNNVPVATLSVGALPLKEKKSVIDTKQVMSEKSLREMIARNLRKEYHAGTKPSVDFIHKILDDAYKSGMPYDVTDLRNKIFTFAASSTNQSFAAIKQVQTMQFKSESAIEEMKSMPKDERLVLFDVEVFPNLFVVCWKYQGASRNSIVTMINPTAQEIENLMAMKLVGFNCRRYDNHILYGRLMGLDLLGLYKLSQRIISGSPNALYGEAYNASYADIYDYNSKKQGLKKWEIELGIHHMELGLPWDEPVPEELWKKVVEYCCNDVEATDAVFVETKGDFVARQILADLSGLSVNATTQQHTSKIVFGDDRRPQEHFVYTDLSEMFPGYKYEMGKSTYRDEITGEGGYVYAEPGIYYDVALLDVASMHPTSIEQLNLFGETYTENFSGLKKARMAIKHKDYDLAKTLLGGKLARHLGDEEEAEALSYALKIVINIVYGLTSAKFDNSFKDPKNIDNIVAKRGALFMIDLKHFVQDYVGRNGERFTVAHIKTDSIKIPNATKEIIEAVMEFGENYGYTFEHEATYEKFCLVNDAVYIAKVAAGRKPAHWTATGAQFQHPFVFKSLFSHQPITLADKSETKAVAKGVMYLDYRENEPPMAFADPNSNGLVFVGKVGMFVPVKPHTGGGKLLRIDDGKEYAVTGTKGFLWMEAEMVKTLNKQRDVDNSYYDLLVEKAIATIDQFGDFYQFVGSEDLAKAA